MASTKMGEAVTSRTLRAEFGRRLARQRLARNVTQAAVAESAGVGLRTLRRIEAGEPSGFDSVLRIAIALGLADALISGVPEHAIRPIERVDSPRGERQRARSRKTSEASRRWSWSEPP